MFQAKEFFSIHFTLFFIVYRYTLCTHTHIHTFQFFVIIIVFFSLLVFDRENKKSRNITVKNFYFLYIGHVYAFMAVYFQSNLKAEQAYMQNNVCPPSNDGVSVGGGVVVTRLLESRALYCIHNFCLFGWIFWFIFFVLVCCFLNGPGK